MRDVESESPETIMGGWVEPGFGTTIEDIEVSSLKML